MGRPGATVRSEGGPGSALRLVGAGLPRTGTSSLKAALERLMGGPCYHMEEVFAHPEHSALWRRALAGDPDGWRACLDGYAAAVDWPASMLWRELAEANAEAVVLLSMRSDAPAWWASVDATIMRVLRAPGSDLEWNAMAKELFDRLGLRDGDPDGAMAASERYNAEVRASAPPERLVEWRPGDGWQPICTALGVPVPDELFPHLNTREEWIEAGPPEPS
jgi:hypothetical protein